MRCLLINPYCPVSEGPTPPLGLSFLAAVLERAEVEVRILDLSVFPFSSAEFKELLDEFNPTLVGITAVTMTFNNAMQTIAAAKRLKPKTTTIMGGPHVSFCAKETLQSHPAIDLLAIGEGEQTLVEVVQELDQGKDWSTIKGLAYRKGSDVLITEKRDYLDVNTLPLPARHLLPLGRYRALHTPITMTTSRGCPHRCIFCVGRKMVGSRVRYRDPISVVDELEMLARLDFPQINIADDLFTAKKSHCLAICTEILRRHLKINWSSFARVDSVSPDLLTKMKEAGCLAISFGVETANPEMLKLIKKGITLEKVRKAISMCAQAGIQPHVSFILGLPSESQTTLQETMAFGKTIEHLGGFYGFHQLAPFPGTAIRDNNADYDLTILTDNWDQYHANHAIVETSGVSSQALNEIAEKWETDTHTKLSAIRGEMAAGTATAEESWQLINLDRFLFIYQMMMENVLQKSGRWKAQENQTSPEQALSELAARIHRQLNQSLEKALDILTYAFDRGSLVFTVTEQNLQWSWRDYL